MSEPIEEPKIYDEFQIVEIKEPRVEEPAPEIIEKPESKIEPKITESADQFLRNLQIELQKLEDTQGKLCKQFELTAQYTDSFFERYTDALREQQNIQTPS